MKAKKSVAFTISICTVYVLTVLFYVISLAVEYKNGAEQSRNRFNSITKDVSRISRTYPPRSEKFYDEVLDSLGNISDIAGIQLAYGNELIFSYPKDLKELNSIRSYLVNPLTTTVFTDKGIPVSKLLPAEKLEEVAQSTMVGGATLTKLLGTSAWMAPGAAASYMVESIVKDQKKMIVCGAYLDGEYGMKDITIGVPCIIGKNGIEKIVELELNEEEKAKLAASEAAVRKTNANLYEAGILKK